MRTLIYCRVSTEQQVAEGYSLAGQERLCREAAAGRGDEVVGVIVDPAEHGDNADRPGLRELRDRLDAGEADGLYVLDLDRFSRDYAYHIIIANEIVQAGHHLYSVSDHADYADEDQRLLLDIKAAVAADELRKIRRRSQRGIAQRARDGLTLGPPPLGYRKQLDERGIARPDLPIIIDEETAPLTRWMFSAYAHGATLQSLAEECNARGVRSQQGKVPWNASHIRRILSNPVYRGMVVHRGEAMPGLHESLIGDQRWQTVQRRIAQRANLHPRSRPTLSPLFCCAVCGGPAKIATHVKGNSYFQCAERFNRPASDRHPPWSWRVAAAEAICWAWFGQLVTEGALTRAAEEQARKRAAQAERDVRQEALDEVAALEDEIAGNVAAAQAGGLPDDMLVEINAPLIARRGGLLQRLERMAPDLRAVDVRWLRDVREALPRLEALADAGRRREFLQRIYTRVELYGDGLRLHHTLAALPPREITKPRYWRAEWGSSGVELDQT